mgnify:CR=1 FL=1
MQASELNKQRQEERLANAKARAAAANYIGKPYSIAHGPMITRPATDEELARLDGTNKRAMGE